MAAATSADVQGVRLLHRPIWLSTLRQRRLIGLLSVIVWLSVWELSVRLQVVNSAFMPPPSSVTMRAIELLFSGVLLRDIGATLERIAVGFLIAVIMGIAVALLCGTFGVVEYAVGPPVELIRVVAPLALLPAFMLILGIGFTSMVAIIVWVSWIPVFLNTLQGMKSVDPLLLRAARSMGSSKVQIALKVVLPSALPYVVVGLRLGLGSAFLVLVAAEMLGANTGLGFYILEASQTFHITEMYAAVVVIGLAGLVLNWGLLLIGERLTPWQRAQE